MDRESGIVSAFGDRCFYEDHFSCRHQLHFTLLQDMELPFNLLLHPGSI